MLNSGDPAEILRVLSAERNPIYAEADIVIFGSEDPPEVTIQSILEALSTHVPVKRVKVQLSQTSYEVLIGTHLLTRAGALITSSIPQKRCCVVTDEMVAGLHLPALEQSLSDAGIAYDTIIVQQGETSKGFETWTLLVEELLARKVDRHTAMVALGGGVIGDLAGFAAAVTLRGLPLVQIPTTLLAQVDSSVGGKTGINSSYGKNLIGAFHQPKLVLADTGVLASLPIRQRAAGYAEIVKAGLIADRDLYEWCERNAERIVEGDTATLADAIERAVTFKANVVSVDEREEKVNNGRALLNLGHTFAHALETETGYGGDLLHGEAVGIGIVLAMELSVLLGFCPREDTDRVAKHLASVGLPIRIRDLPMEHLLKHMKQDKKMRDGKLTFVLMRGIGQAFTNNDVPEDAVRAILLSGGARP